MKQTTIHGDLTTPFAGESLPKTTAREQCRQKLLLDLGANDAPGQELLFDTDGIPLEEDKTMRFRMFYNCSECGEQWEMEHDCHCNDRCPECDMEIEPDEWETVKDDTQIRN